MPLSASIEAHLKCLYLIIFMDLKFFPFIEIILFLL